MFGSEYGKIVYPAVVALFCRSGFGWARMKAVDSGVAIFGSEAHWAVVLELLGIKKSGSG